MTGADAYARHGGEVYAAARKLRVSPGKVLDFSSNANIFARHITEELVRETPYPFLHYPDSRAAELTEAIARHENVTPDRILVGNGAAELIWLTMQGFAPRKVLFLGPIFSEYVSACEALGISYEILTPPVEQAFDCDRRELAYLRETDADLVVLCTPNNPAGVTYPGIAGIMGMLRSPRVLIDNSYREFLYGTDAYEENHLNVYASLARPGVSVFTINSFTKFFCCPGIRLGYLMGDRLQLERLAQKRPSWMVSPFAQIMGGLFLKHVEDYRATLAPLSEALSVMGRELHFASPIDPHLVFEGPGFFCCGLKRGMSAATVREKLFRHCILVRNCDTIPGMPQGFIRVQARPHDDAARLLEVLESLV